MNMKVADFLYSYLSSVNNELTFKLKWIDLRHVCNLVLVDNDRSISKHQNIQDKGFCKLSNSVVGDVSHDMKAIISDCSKFEKLDIQEEKYLNFILDK